MLRVGAYGEFPLLPSTGIGLENYHLCSFDDCSVSYRKQRQASTGYVYGTTVSRLGVSMFRRSRVSLAAAMAVGGLAIVATPAIAQDSGQRVEVTGSRIKRTDTETASPVQVLTREDIERTGKSSIEAVLRGLTVDGVGSIPGSFSNGFATGSAAVSLRGLGVNSTLVLVNGRRMTTYGLADDGTRNFVDLNSLPLEAVERIEVLKDGASAIYGADAVGGVVNIILRKNYTGRSMGASYGQANEGDGQTTRAYGTYRLRQPRHRQVQRLLHARGVEAEEHLVDGSRLHRRRPISPRAATTTSTNGAESPVLRLGRRRPTRRTVWCATRPGHGHWPAGERDPLRSLARSTPATGLCRYNSRVEQEVQPEIERINLFTRGTLQFSPALTAYTGTGLLQHQDEGQRHAGRQQRRRRVRPGDPVQSAARARPDDSAGHASGQHVRRRPPRSATRPIELGGRDQTTDNKVLRASWACRAVTSAGTRTPACSISRAS